LHQVHTWATSRSSWDFVPQVLFCLCGILKEQSCCCHDGVRRWIRNSKLSRTQRYRNYLGGRNCRKREIRIIRILKKKLHRGCTRTRCRGATWAAASRGGGARERRRLEDGREEGSCRRRRKRGRGRRRVCIARIPDGSQSGGQTGGTESIGTGRERGRVASGTSLDWLFPIRMILVCRYGHSGCGQLFHWRLLFCFCIQVFYA